MQLLVWNEELATAAQNNTDRCVLASDPDRASRVPSLDTVGSAMTAVASRTPNYSKLRLMGGLKKLNGNCWGLVLLAPPVAEHWASAF